ncbi:MAG: hypothetical protein Q8S33_25915 [Myxococcales bacterium]|nr:hypothetical protein [Myxococcales bacterium]
MDEAPALPFVTAALLFATLRPAAETLEAVREALAEARVPADEQTWLRWLGGDASTPFSSAAFRRFPWPAEMKVAEAVVDALCGDLPSARARLGAKLEAKTRAPVRKTKRATAPMRDQVAAQAILSMVEPGLVAPEVLRESFRRLFDWSGTRLETVTVHRSAVSRSRAVPLESVLEHLPFIELLRQSVEPGAPLTLVRSWLWPRPTRGGVLVGPREEEEVDRGVRETFSSALVVDTLPRQFSVPLVVTEPLELLRAMVQRRLRGDV